MLEEEEERDPKVKNVQTYPGRTKPNWKLRLGNHIASFQNLDQKTDSGLREAVKKLLF